MHRFGAFYMDYLYTMEDSSGKGIVLVHSPSQSLFGHLATSSLFFFLSVMFPFSLPGSPFLSFALSISFRLSSLSNKPHGDLKKELVLFQSQPPGP